METVKKYVELTDQNFDQEVLKSEIPVLVDFTAAWCGPCKMMNPVIDQLAEEYNGKVVISKLDVDSNPLITSKYGIKGLPTFLVIVNGVVTDKIVGAAPKKAFDELLRKY
ncbi:MAG: thioredoxin [Cytophagaceae bacterium]